LCEQGLFPCNIVSERLKKYLVTIRIMNGKKRSLSRRSSRRRGSKLSIGAQLSDGPAYAGQQKSVFRLPGTPTLLTTTVTSGLIANSTNISTGNISGFSTRFGSTFDEYRILGCDVIMRPVAASTGISVVMFDEKSSAVPTSSDAANRVGRRLINSNASSDGGSVVMKWRARDLVDLQYTAIGTGVTPCYVKVYTDAATWGAPVVATALWIIEPMLIIEFRGIKSN
jgi:hypothetical protein